MPRSHQTSPDEERLSERISTRRRGRKAEVLRIILEAKEGPQPVRGQPSDVMFKEELERYKLNGTELLRSEVPMLISRALQPGAKSDYMYFVSDVLIDLKDFVQAIQVLARIKELYGLSDVGHNLLGFCKWELDCEEEAYQVYKQSLNLNPRNLSSLRGACYLGIETDHDDEAADYCREFYEGSGQTKEAAVWYATALHNSNRREQLSELLRQRLTRFGPEDDLAEFIVIGKEIN